MSDDYVYRPRRGLFLCLLVERMGTLPSDGRSALHVRTPRAWAEDRDIGAARVRARQRLGQYIEARRAHGESPMPDDFVEQVFFLPDP